jgi:hypothetical protein
LAYPDLHWKGAQIIAASLLDVPISFVSIILACLVVWPEFKLKEAWTRWDDEQVKKRLEERIKREGARFPP